MISCRWIFMNPNKVKQHHNHMEIQEIQLILTKSTLLHPTVFILSRRGQQRGSHISQLRMATTACHCTLNRIKNWQHLINFQRRAATEIQPRNKWRTPRVSGHLAMEITEVECLILCNNECSISILKLNKIKHNYGGSTDESVGVLSQELPKWTPSLILKF